ncbi:MAG: hypothetical protein GY786_04270 [Proteobacteria bacterium]|nr:hypothetical protein [Pseudomonadota bacterium]
MNQSEEITPYNITKGEKVYYGYYAALETIFRQFVSDLESYFFDEFNLSFGFTFEIQGGIKFKNFLNKLDKPKPIFWYEISPLKGDCLLILENRFANLLMSKPALNQSGRVAVNNRFQVNGDNYETLRNSVDSILEHFSNSWGIIVPAEKKLKKLVSHRFKAKVMNPLEACVVVSLQLVHKNFISHCKFCFSAYQLDSILKKYGKKTLLRGEGVFVQNRDVGEYFSHLIEEEASYELTGVLGEINLSRNELIKSYQEGSIIPLDNVLKNNAVVKINGVPLLSANTGMTLEKYSIQVNGRYESMEGEIKKRQRPFAKLQFPKL